MVRRSASHAENSGFKSPRDYQYGDGGAKVAYRSHKPKTRFESYARIHVGKET